MTGDANSVGRGGGIASMRAVPCIHARRNEATWTPPRRGNCLTKTDKTHQDPAEHPSATMDSPPVEVIAAQARSMGSHVGAACTSAPWREASNAVLMRMGHGQGPIPRVPLGTSAPTC